MVVALVVGLVMLGARGSQAQPVSDLPRGVGVAVAGAGGVLVFGR